MLWKLAHNRVLELKNHAIIMGILNVTPDSFSDAGQYDAVDNALKHASMMIDQGAHIIDIGGQSTRPNASDVDPIDEQHRVLPIIEALKDTAALISIDTFHTSTAQCAIAAGAHIINDVTGLQGELGIAKIVNQTGAGVCIMHNSRNRECLPDVIQDQKKFFERSLTIAQKMGVAKDQIVLDVGFGFGKETTDHNIELMARITDLLDIGFPLMVGTSRKRFLGGITNRESYDRDSATAATSALLRQKGIDIFRVHNVNFNKDALLVSDAVLNFRKQQNVYDNS
jgi:dihydropteroate synthase